MTVALLAIVVWLFIIAALILLAVYLIWRAIRRWLEP